MDDDIKKHVSKTGTTTVGVVCKDGIVLAGDRKITLGNGESIAYISPRNEDKVVFVTDNLLVSTAGNASDLQRLVKLVRAELRLRELKTGQKSSVKDSANLFTNIVYQSIRNPSVIVSITHFLIAGYDDTGAYMYEVGADGTLTSVEEWRSTGSGMMQADPILDLEHKKDITLEEGIDLVKKCVNASRKRDPASGEGIDAYVIKKGEIKRVLKQKLVSEFRDRE